MRYGILFNRATIAGLASIAAWLAVTASCKQATNDPGLDDSGEQPPPQEGPQGPFDFLKFRNNIQPILDTAEDKGCTASACHGSAEGVGGFKLFREPGAGTAEELANFTEITTTKVNLQVPNESTIYLRAKNKHNGGKSALASADQQTALLTWIQEAKAANDGQNPPAPDPGTPTDGGVPTPGPNGCIDPKYFSLGAFQSDILPILTGQRDYNRPDQAGNGVGCAGGTCHGVDRPNALVIKKNASPAENLKSFACYVNINNPVQSNIVICPRGKNACKKFPHPGGAFFTAEDDPNYERVLSFLYATKTAQTPLDFAFFARQVAPIFGDTQIGGAAGRSCADTTACHGVASQNSAPPNGSNLPMVAGATDESRLGFNFSAASNFAQFIGRPEDSYLFLYPTNEIARNPNEPGASKFARGVAHTGGKLINVSSKQARDILQWANGLQLTSRNYQLNWLVGGDYITNNINDNTAAGTETTLAPSIFKRMGTNTFNGGIWDGLFADDFDGGFVDFNRAFPRDPPIDRAAFAVAYILNTTPNNIDAQITVRSTNEIKLYADQGVALVKPASQQAGTAQVSFTSPTAQKKVTRLLLKGLQRSNERQFGFTFEITDINGNPLRARDIIIKLSPEGGI